MTIRLYHPNLEPPNNECEVQTEAQAAIYAESGWLPAPEPTERPGFAPEPPRYEPADTSVSGDYQNFTVAQLSDELKDRGLPVSGTKDELIARLVADDETDA